MILTCPTCAATTAVPDDRLPPEGARARCQSCGGVSVYYRGGLVGDDPTPPNGLDSSMTQVLTHPESPESQAALPSIALARPLPTEKPPPPPPAASAGPAKSIGWQIRTATGDQGPLTQDALKPLIRDGRFGPEDLACPPGAAEWMRAADLPDLQRWFALQRKAAGAAAGKAALPVAAMAPCHRHPGVRGRWLCQGCGDLSCDDCVISGEVMRVLVRQCPACRKACTELVPTKKITPFWEELPVLLTYPVRGLGWLGLILFPLLGIGVALSKAAAAAMVLAWGAAAFMTLAIYSYHLHVIRTSTKGERSMPNLGKVENYQDELIKPAAKAAFVSFLLFLPTIWASNGVHSARLELGLVTGLRDSIAADKAEAAKRAEDPQAHAGSEGSSSEESVEGALESALASMASGGGSPEDFGNAMGSALGALHFRGDRDYEAELLEANASVASARTRVFNKELIRAIAAGIALFIWPIFLIIVALFNTIIPVFQPQVLLKLIQEIPREYAWCTAITSACFIAIYLLNLPMRNTMIFSNWLTSPLTYYFSLIAFHVMGRTAELAEQKVDWH